MGYILGLLGLGSIGVVLVALCYLAIYAFSGLIFWGLGNFIIWVFGISYTWTYLHGVAAAIIIHILKSIFKRTININD